MTPNVLFTAAAVFALGVRHGADPDHVAAIDALTRNGAARRAPLSRFTGAFFAFGHAIVVLSISAIIGSIGSNLSREGSVFESAGAWLSICLLFGMAAVNIAAMRRGPAYRPAGIKPSLLSRWIAGSSKPASAVAIGMAFGLGFDTPSQIAAYALAFSGSASLGMALIIGAAFAAGIAATDVIDSALVFAMCRSATVELDRATRVWNVAISCLALAAGGYELFVQTWWRSTSADLFMSAAFSAILVGLFVWLSVSAAHRRAGAKAMA